MPQPRHWDEKWQHRPLVPATEEEPQKPPIGRPERLTMRYNTTQGRAFAKAYWEETHEQSWNDVHEILASGHNVGLLVHLSGLVVLDCDVRVYDAKHEFVVASERKAATLETVTAEVTRHGIEDLSRVVTSLGHDATELATYTVETKSGGVHLYYRQNPRHTLTSRGHRQDWHVDVKGSENQWVVAPPTPGYRVLRDMPVAEMPLWLAQWLDRVNQHLAPTGGARARRLRERTETLRLEALQGEYDAGLLATWVNHEQQNVALANRQNQGWNQAIFECACNLLDGGISREHVDALIRDAAQPRTPRDDYMMRDTIRSAARRRGYRE